MFSLASFAQLPIDTVTKKVAFTGVETVSGGTVASLYARAKKLNVSGTNVLADKPADGIYSYKGSFPVKYQAPQPGLYHEGTVTYTVLIACKDGKYKYIITDLVHTSPKGNGGGLERSVPECNKYVLTPQGWGTIKGIAKVEMEKLIANIKKGMGNANELPVNVGNDW
jgi:hypothetical protein